MRGGTAFTSLTLAQRDNAPVLLGIVGIELPDGKLTKFPDHMDGCADWRVSSSSCHRNDDESLDDFSHRGLVGVGILHRVFSPAMLPALSGNDAWDKSALAPEPFIAECAFQPANHTGLAA